VIKPILCLDFDGVIHSYTRGWSGANVVSDAPVKGAFDFIGPSPRNLGLQAGEVEEFAR
jgi:hypothetical protein